MARQFDAGIGKPTLRVCRAHDTRGRERRIRVFAVRGDDEVVTRRLLEALKPAPRGVLNLQESTIGDEDHVEQTVGYNDVLGALDHAGEDSHRRGEGRVSVGEDIDV